jgi:PKD repeat protein
MGKVTHAVYGSPIKNHEIYIISDSVESVVMDYYNEVKTNEDGFYYDTITTFLDAGKLVIYTYDYDGTKMENDVHFRFMSSENDNVFINNYIVNVPFLKPSLQAKFSIFKDENHNKYTFAFFDETENENILSWKWNFGDNTISTLQNPKHIYSEPGIYLVSLTVEATIYDHVEVNTISEYIYIPANAYYHLGGHCFADNFPIDNGLAYLYSFSNLENMRPLDTAEIDTLGYYYFYQVQEGQYVVKVQPDKQSEYYGIVIPTYLGNELFWENAQLIEHDQTSWEYDIQLIEGVGTTSGDGLIAGQVKIGVSPMFFSTKDLARVDIYLLDENEIPLSSRYTDSEGNFDFDELALETYWMCQEMTGVPKDKVRIDLNEETPEVTDITIDMYTGDITLDVAENNWFRDVGNPYPNPASNQVSLNVDMKSATAATAELIDLQGRVIFRENIDLRNGQNNLNFQVSGLENGFYLIRLNAEGFSLNKQMVISR